MYELGAQAPAAGLSLRRLRVVARRQWWVVLVCVLLAAVGSAAYVKTRPVTYTASTVVNVAPPAFTNATSGGATPTASSGLLKGTLDPAQEVLAEPVVRAATAAGHAAPVSLTATASGDQTTVKVSATGGSAAQATAMANAAADAFAKQRIRDLDAAARGLAPRLRGLNRQITRLQQTIKAAGHNGTVGGERLTLGVLSGQYTTYEGLQQVLNSAALSTAVPTPAVPVEAKHNGRGRSTVEVAVLAGLLAGLGIALAREQFDDRIRSAAELGESVGTEVLAELPASDLRSRSATIADQPSGELAEAVRELRTALRFLSVRRPMRTILVTSARVGEGKSFVAANLAAAWAISGVRTILVSSDLRRPTLEKLFKAEAPRRGLSEAIIDAALGERFGGAGAAGYGGGAGPVDAGAGGGGGLAVEVGAAEARDVEIDVHDDVDDLLVPTGVDNLLLLPSGPKPPNPAELLGSPELGKLLVSLREQAEIVILDSPPVLAVTDALVLTAQADGVLLVVRENRTSRSAAHRALRQLESGLAPVLGVVVNRSSRPGVERY